jgi:nitrogen regulatory protein P-II 1
MKLIMAYVRPERMRDVKTELAKAEIHRMSIDNVRISGDSPAVHEQYRGADLYIDTHARVRFEIAVNDVFVEPAIEAIMRGAKTGDDGDGHVIVLNIEHAVRIRNGQTAGDAIE